MKITHYIKYINIYIYEDFSKETITIHTSLWDEVKKLRHKESVLKLDIIKLIRVNSVHGKKLTVSFLLFTSLNSELAPNTVEDFKNLRFNPFSSDNSLCVSDSSEPANDCKRMRTLGGKAHVYANVPL